MAIEMGFESVVYLDQATFADWVLERQGWDINHYELLNGRIVMNPPAFFIHGLVEAAIVRHLGNFVVPRNLGLVMGSSAGFELPSGDTVEPDVTFISVERWQALPQPDFNKFAQIVPDLLVEILSRSTASRDRGEKKGIYERNGVDEYWLVDPLARTVRVFHLIEGRYDTGTLFEADNVLASALLTGFEVLVGDLFP